MTACQEGLCSMYLVNGRDQETAFNEPEVSLRC